MWQNWDAAAPWPGLYARQQHVMYMLAWYMAQYRRMDLMQPLLYVIDHTKAPTYANLQCLEAAYVLGDK